MAFLGKIGKSLGIGGLTHGDIGKSLLNIAGTVGGYALGGPVGAGIGNASAQKLQGASFKDAAIGGLSAYGLGSLGAGAGNLISAEGGVGNALKALPSKAASYVSDLGTNIEETASGAYQGAKNALGFPVSTVDPAAQAALSGAGDVAGAAAPVANAGGQTLFGPGTGDAISTAAGTGGAADVGLTSQLGGSLATPASASALPASTASTSGGLLSSAKDFLAKNGRTLASLAPVAQAVMAGNQAPAELGPLNAQAADLAAQGHKLTDTLSSGKLPEGMEQNFDTALQDAVTSIKTKYAGLGLAGSTMETQEINAAKERVEGLKAQQLESLATMGLNMTNSSSDLYGKIMQQNIQSDSGLSSAISNAVGSLGNAPPAQ